MHPTHVAELLSSRRAHVLVRPSLSVHPASLESDR
jgi:hypothetical protein